METKDSHSFTISIEKTNEKMEFKTIFDKDYPDLYQDEPAGSGGEDKYPNASRILTSAVMNCLSASLTFCLSKSKVPMEQFKLKATATTTIARNEQNRLRVKNIKVVLEPVFNETPEFSLSDFQKKLERCMKISEDYCVVTQAVRNGIDVETEFKTNF